MEIKSSKTLVDEALAQIKTLTTTEVKELMKDNKCTLVDIRDIRELWNEGSIKDAIHIPRGMLEFWLDPLSPYFKKYKFDLNCLYKYCKKGKIHTLYYNPRSKLNSFNDGILIVKIRSHCLKFTFKEY